MAKRNLKDCMEVEFEHDGNVVINYMVTWSNDLKNWRTVFFESCDAAREYALAKKADSEEAGLDFHIAVDRANQLIIDDFMNVSVNTFDIKVVPTLALERQFCC